MPIHKVENGWRWGSHGKVYPSRAGAEKQAEAAYANGYKGDAKAAGVAMVEPKGELLFLKRSDAGDHPGEWCFPGGGIEAGETPSHAAMRELYEETGYMFGTSGARFPDDCVDYRDGFVTFAADVPIKFTPTLNAEHTDFIWARPESPPQPLHPGVAASLSVERQIELIGDRKVTKDFAGYYAPEKLGKSRKVTPEGWLILEGTPIARTGEQVYAAHELEGLEPDGDGHIVVERRAQEVFDPASLASLEGKDYVVEHPPDGVDTENWKNHTVGHVQNVRRGSGIEDDLVIADIFVKDPIAIEYVNKHLPENSVGYIADYEQLGPGRAVQRNIICNHVAAVEAGRAGARVAVRDHLHTGDTKMPRTVGQIVKETLTKLGVLTGDQEALIRELNGVTALPTRDADVDTGTADRLSAMDAVLKKVSDWQDARDAKEVADKAAADKAMKDEEEERERKKKHEGAGEALEAVGDTILEAEGTGKVLNLGKLWTGGMTGDSAEPVHVAVVSRAEVLAPGIAKPTADSLKGNNGTVLARFMRDSLNGHCATPEGRADVAAFLLGRKVDDLKGADLVGVFNGATALAKARNNRGAAAAATARHHTGDFSGVKSISDINAANKAFWDKSKAG